MGGFIFGFAAASGWLIIVGVGWMIRAAFSVSLDLGEG